jgi:hypothetical protein
MAAPIYRTKGDLRASLLVKLGYGGLGSAAGNFVPMADELLEEAQQQLYILMPDEKRIRTWDMYTGINQRWYDFPADCDPDRICNLSAYFSQQWLPITRGIDRYHDSNYDYISYYPQRYDFRARVGTSIEEQVNGNFSTPDATATGGNGWSWLSSLWKIEGGYAKHTSQIFGYLKSDVPAIIGNTYDISYEISIANADSVVFGGTNVDTDGNSLPFIAGTHTARVKAITTDGFWLLSVLGLAWLDNVSVKFVDPAALPVSLELWPTDESTSYLFRIEGYIQLMPFVADADRATVDDTLILLYAEAYGKAHLNKPDAQAKMQVLERRLKKLRGQQHGEQRYIRGEKETVPLPWPIVVE